MFGIDKDKGKRIKKVAFDTSVGYTRVWYVRNDGTFTESFPMDFPVLNILQTYLAISPDWSIAGSVILPGSITVFYERKESGK